MALPETIRAAVASAFRKLPQIRGLHRVAMTINQALLGVGASPHAKASMRDGTHLIVDLRTMTESFAFYSGRYDADILDVVCSLVDVDAAFLDVGANIGFYTVAVGNHIRRRNGRGRIFGFEPLEGNYNRNIANIRGNDLEQYCFVVKSGLSNGKRTSLLALREDFRGGSETGNASIAISPEYDAGFATVPILVQRLDDLWPALGEGLTIDFVKVDIEGHEDFFLEGAAATLAQHRPTILMEVNKPYYAARGVDLDVRFAPLVPPSYSVFRRDGEHWTSVTAFSSCSTIDNVLMVPREKLKLPAYRRFPAA